MGFNSEFKGLINVPRFWKRNWTWGNNYKRNWTEPAYMVRPCSENGRRKITQNSIELDAETKESTRKTEVKLDLDLENLALFNLSKDQT